MGTMQYIGPNTTAPGVYDLAREKAGPNAFQLAVGQTWTDSSAKYVNRDCMYLRQPSSLAATPIVVQRFRGYDAGRAFCSVTNGENLTVEDFVAENVAHTFLNCEVDFPGTTVPAPVMRAKNIVFRRGQVGRCGYFLTSSKGNMTCEVSVTLEDIVQIPGTSLSNLAWWAANPHTWASPARTTPWKSLTMRRVSVKIDNDLTDSFKNMYDPAGAPIVTGDYTKAIFAINVALTLQDVWINGRPITENDIQWRWTDAKGAQRGIPPVITHTPGWNPSMIAPPRMTGVVTPPPPVVVPPPVVTPPPVPAPDPCADLKSQVASMTSQIGALKATLDTVTRDRDIYKWTLGVSEAKVAELQAKITAAQTALK